MVYYKTEEEIALIRESCLLVCRTLAHVASLLRPGVTGATLDREAEAFIREHGGVPGFKGYRGFPATLCFSPNEVVVHGIPSDEPIREGDIISVDCGVKMNGYYGDAAYTFAVGPVREEVMHLLRVTRTSLYKGIEQAVAGKRLGDIGHAIQHYVEQVHGYKVVRELVGHGIGKNLHESPEVPNYGTRGRGMKLKPGLTIAIEPMVNTSRRHVSQADDGWTILARDRMPSAHYEHTVAVRTGQAELLSDHEPIERAVAQNPHLQSVELLEMVR